MATNNAVTSSVALTGLRDELNKLSGTLHEISELMSEDMTQLGKAWQDAKYQDFVQGYKPQINKCEEISKRYKAWCTSKLDPIIKKVVSLENQSVIVEGETAGGSDYNSASGDGTATTDASASVGESFNMGDQKTGSQHVQTQHEMPQTQTIPESFAGNVESKKPSFKEKAMNLFDDLKTRAIGSEDDIECQKKKGWNYRAVEVTDPSDPNLIHVKQTSEHTGSHFEFEGSMESSAGVDIPVVDAKVGVAQKLQPKYIGGVDKEIVTSEHVIKCKPKH
jgi:hypothetical protein